MATLFAGELSLEIAHREFTYGWVHYDICLRWRGQPLLDDAMLRRDGEIRARRGEGAIDAGEIGECGALPLLRSVLETNQPRYWEPMDPDIVLAVYTKDHFPFMLPTWDFEGEPPEPRRRARPASPRTAPGRPLPTISSS
jgi:hypothetical protein